MSSTPIFTSPFLNLTFVERLLSNLPPSPATSSSSSSSTSLSKPEIEIEKERAKLLSSKVYLLVNPPPPSQPGSETSSTEEDEEAESREEGFKSHNVSVVPFPTSSSSSTATPTAIIRRKRRKLKLSKELEIVKTRSKLGQTHMRLLEITEAEAELAIVELTLRRLLRKVGAEDPNPDEENEVGTTGHGKIEGKGVPDGVKKEQGRQGGKDDLKRMKRTARIQEMRSLRAQVLKDLIIVEGALGREGRVRRWTKNLKRLENGGPLDS